MKFDFSNKVALVTGGTSGIGRTTALAFAQAGAKVVISGRRETEGKAVVAEIAAAGGTARFVRADVAVEADVKNLVEQTVAAFGRLDIAFNNAGVEWMAPLANATEADYRRLFDTNVWGVIASLKYEIPAMLKTGGGAIVNTSSVAGHVGMAGASLYIGTKHAVEGLSKSIALEFANQGIRINAVAPAVIDTAMVDRFAGKDGPQREHLASLHPIGRTGKTDEVANAVLFLCSDAASFILGESLKVDGGLTVP
ncbi:short-chain dehydrogenase/reductase SDR [Chthoniobacter flavus Ellin428]|uniref:Short-chain dehydrogenase/reductase SDR n=1 Tax=Chthoniobacter flavus Ellin428 TaxID=497964 RepID=B4CYI1_9BACT|nr:glucose 1-dehydrogenase [Chthoniobacter flavus]EDY20522.1 short-chain dehydrogenase/reductase SDR [Chthoniobacter flavus Ellin428]TCO89963.1 NAD(P)-dependent dehydrogenase (short-subunit alcohol dehydrogenase family) [Chthoniobacter flavus]